MSSPQPTTTPRAPHVNAGPASRTKPATPQPQPGRNKFVTTVNLEPDVLAVLGDLQNRLDRNRSYLVNALVRDFIRRSDMDPETLLATFQPQLAPPPSVPGSRS